MEKAQSMISFTVIRQGTLRESEVKETHKLTKSLKNVPSLLTNGRSQVEDFRNFTLTLLVLKRSLKRS